MITIRLNGNPLELDAEIALPEFLTQHTDNADDDCFALAINESFVPRSHYSMVTIKSGDQIELLKPMQGG